MEHPGFYHRAGPFTLARIAEESGAALADETRAGIEVTDIRPLDAAGPVTVDSSCARKNRGTLSDFGAMRLLGSQ